MSKNWQIINGTYGSSHTPCTVLVYHDDRKQGYWYCIEGSKNVNYTYDYLQSGVYFETIEDVDCFTTLSEIETIDNLIATVEEQ